MLTDRLADIFHQWLLAVFCDQLRELFNAEITRFRYAWDLPGRRLWGDVIVQPACRCRHQFNLVMLVLASGLAARNAATRAAICLSSSGLLTARLLPPEACGFLPLPTGDPENSRCR